MDQDVTYPSSSHDDVFPASGARARLLRRFERDLAAWLETAEGRFAAYCAERDRGRSADGAIPFTYGGSR